MKFLKENVNNTLIRDNVDIDVKLRSEKRILVRGSYHQVDAVFFKTYIDYSTNKVFGYFDGYAHNDIGQYESESLDLEDLLPYENAPNAQLTLDILSNYVNSDGHIVDIENFVKECFKHGCIFYENQEKEIFKQ